MKESGSLFVTSNRTKDRHLMKPHFGSRTISRPGRRLLVLRTRITAGVPLIGDGCAVCLRGVLSSQKKTASQSTTCFGEDTTGLPVHLLAAWCESETLKLGLGAKG
jgi:hypothetical protein